MPDSNIKVNETIIANSYEKAYKVSAIISTFNSEKFIKGRLDNLLKQTISNDLEIVIINSNSRENEDEIIASYLQNYKNITYVVTDKTETIYQAWNRGIKHSKGTYITNANTDDRLKDAALKRLSEVLDNCKDVAAVYADQYISNIPNQEFNEIKNGKSFRRYNFTRIHLLNDCIVGSQALWRARLHHKDNIWFSESLEIAGDYDFFCRVAELYRIKYLKGILGVYYMSTKNTNKQYQDIDKTLEETLFIKENYSGRYIKSLSNKELFRLKIKIILAKSIPVYVYKIINFMLKRIVPTRRMPEKLFYIYLSAIIAEKNNNIGYAMRLLNRNLKANYPLINYHYKRIAKNES